MKRNVALYVRDILQNMRDAEDFIQGLTYEQFASDKKTGSIGLTILQIS